MTLQDISVRTHVLTQVTNITPISTGRNVAIERVAFPQHHGKEFLTEVKLFVLLKVRKHLRVENIDARIDGITKNFTPTRLLQELRDMPALIGNDDTILQRIMHVC